jgi:pentatricopeptide repeat protein
MIDAGIKGDVISYTAIIDACAKAGNIARAEAWLQKMLDAGVEANVVTFGALIHACARLGDATRAEHWLEQMQIAGVKANAVTYNAVMSACTKSGDVDRAEKWLNKMRNSGVVPDVVSYNTLITALAKTGDLVKAEEWLQRMEDAGITPNLVPFLCMIMVYSQQGNVSAVERLSSEVMRRRLKPDARFVSAIILAYGNATPRQPQQALVAFQRLVARGIPVDHVTVQELARTVGRKMALQVCNELGLDDVHLQSRRSQRNNLSRSDGMSKTSSESKNA